MGARGGFPIAEDSERGNRITKLVACRGQFSAIGQDAAFDHPRFRGTAAVAGQNEDTPRLLSKSNHHLECAQLEMHRGALVPRLCQFVRAVRSLLEFRFCSIEHRPRFVEAAEGSQCKCAIETASSAKDDHDVALHQGREFDGEPLGDIENGNCPRWPVVEQAMGCENELTNESFGDSMRKKAPRPFLLRATEYSGNDCRRCAHSLAEILRARCDILTNARERP